MAHRVHPKAFRIKEIADWNSRGFYKKNLSKYLREDFEIREFLKKKLANMGVDKIEIERFIGRLSIIIFSSRPGLLIGRGGGGVEELRKALEKALKTKKIYLPIKDFKIEIREIKNPWLSASLASQWMTQQIEKRVPYRRVLKQALDKITSHKSVQGARVEVAGRLDGKTIARREWLKKGMLPRQTIRADIDYAQTPAFCSYGVVGVKVWIYKGERFDHPSEAKPR